MFVHHSSPPKLLKVGSAPAGTGALIVNPTSWRAESPLQHRGIGFDVQRPFGVLHRIDSQPAGSFHSTLSLNPVQPLRCPSCRLHCELCCAKCATQKMGLHNLRDVNREFYLRKAEICTQIDQELQAEMRYQSDLHAKQRTIRETSEAISVKTDNITRLKRQLLTLKTRTSKFEKNVSTLERKSVSHAIRIQKNNQDNDKLRLTLQELETKNFQYVRFLTILLDHYIPIRKFELTTEKQRSIPSTVTSVITGLVASTQPVKPMATAVKSWPPVKNYYFTINGCEARDNSEYHPLESELIAGSTLVLSSRAQPAFAALTYLTQFTSSMSILLDFNLPYRFTVRDLATWSRWTGDSFASDQYRLNTNVISLCAAFGLSNDVLRLQSPFNNLFVLIQELRKNTKINSISGLLNEQTKHQLVETFNKINYEEREDEFSIEQIEEDWVSVDYAVLR